MLNIKITIQYDGTDFAGWQIQPNVPTIQGEIEAALESIYQMPIRIYGSGRTDRGVHSLGQVASFNVPTLKMPIEKFHNALNYYLPRSVRVINACEVDTDFHARFSARYREYIYVIDNSKVYMPFYEKYAYSYPRCKIDTDEINKYANLILGEHDFTSFCSVNDENEHKCRYIQKCYSMRRGDLVYIIVRGNAFLHNMVRIIVGTLITLEDKKEPYEKMTEILEAKDRTKALVTAPPHGLYFRRIFY